MMADVAEVSATSTIVDALVHLAKVLPIACSPARRSNCPLPCVSARQSACRSHAAEEGLIDAGTRLCYRRCAGTLALRPPIYQVPPPLPALCTFPLSSALTVYALHALAAQPTMGTGSAMNGHAQCAASIAF